MKKLNRKGFTLVELLAVIVILAIVVGIAIPSVTSIINGVKRKALETAVLTAYDYLKDQFVIYNTNPSVADEKFQKHIINHVGKYIELESNIPEHQQLLSAMGFTQDKGIRKMSICIAESGDIQINLLRIHKDSEYYTANDWVQVGNEEFAPKDTISYGNATCSYR